MKRTTTLIASTIFALSAAPLMAAGHAVMYDAGNTLEGKTAQVESLPAETGGMVFSSDGKEIGTITDFSIDNQNRARFIIDVAASSNFLGDLLILSADPEDVTIANGSAALSATENELQAMESTSGDSRALRINL